MRQGELLSLTWGSGDRARGVVLLEVTKNGRGREVPLNGPADAVLARRTPDEAGDELLFGTRSWDAFRKGWQAALAVAKLATSTSTISGTPSPRRPSRGAPRCPRSRICWATAPWRW